MDIITIQELASMYGISHITAGSIASRAEFDKFRKGYKIINCPKMHEKFNEELNLRPKLVRNIFKEPLISKNNLAKQYHVCIDTIRTITARSEFDDFRVPKNTSRYYLKDCKEMHDLFKVQLKIKYLYKRQNKRSIREKEIIQNTQRGNNE